MRSKWIRRSALPKEDIERMMRDAEQYAEEDRKRRDDVETRNQAESLVYQTEKFLADNADKFESGAAADAKSNVTGPLNDLKKALEGEDVPAIKAATDTLAQVSQSLGAALYANAQSAEGGSGAGEGGGGGHEHADGSAGTAESEHDDVVDAEIVDEGEHK